MLLGSSRSRCSSSVPSSAAALPPYTSPQLHLNCYGRDEDSCHCAWLVSRVYGPDAGLLVADSWDTVANAPAGSCA